MRERKGLVIDRDADLRIEMRAYLDTLTITGDNIGEIRRLLFMPWDSAWNGWVRDDTAEREMRAHNRKKQETSMSEFTQYRRTQIAEMRPYVEGENISERVSVSAPDRENGSPNAGDMIARNPANHDDQWLVAAAYFAANFEPVA